MRRYKHPPAVVLAAYFDRARPTPTHHLLKGGEVNRTWLITHDGTQYILQQLSPIFTVSTVQDSVHITNALTAVGWQASRTIPTRDNSPYMTHKNSLWRLQSFITSDSQPPALTPQLMGEIGQFLATLHKELRRIPYRPTGSLPHFHDSEYYIRALASLVPHMNDPSLRKTALEICRNYYALPPLPSSDSQLIHGDPRLNNILFRHSQPYAVIDWDTLMVGTIWVDIGDLMRSITEECVLHDAANAIELCERFCGSYFGASATRLSQRSFQDICFLAASTIALELASRYAADCVLDSYFAWDTSRFGSRYESNRHRLTETMAVVDQLRARTGVTYA